MTQRLKLSEETMAPRFVVNDKYREFHVALNCVDIPAAEWKTWCGWPYDRSVFERRAKVQDDLDTKFMRPRCFLVPMVTPTTQSTRPVSI